MIFERIMRIIKKEEYFIIICQKMEFKNTRLIKLVLIAIAISSTSCSISVTRNYYNVKSKTPIEIDSTTQELKLDAQAHKNNDG